MCFLQFVVAEAGADDLVVDLDCSSLDAGGRVLASWLDAGV